MRALVLPRPGQDTAAARAELAAALGEDGRTVMVVRGSGGAVEAFVALAVDRARDFPWRAVVRVEDSRIFEVGQELALFGADPGCCAVVVDRTGQPGARLRPDASFIEIDRAFNGAIAGGAS